MKTKTKTMIAEEEIPKAVLAKYIICLRPEIERILFYRYADVADDDKVRIALNVRNKLRSMLEELKSGL